MSIYKVEAEGDTMYIQADTQDAARERLTEFVGNIPERMLTWTIVDDLPEGEEFL